MLSKWGEIPTLWVMCVHDNPMDSIGKWRCKTSTLWINWGICHLGMLKPKNSNLHRNEMKDFGGKTQGGKNRWMLWGRFTQLCEEQLWPWHPGTQVGLKMSGLVKLSLQHAHGGWWPRRGRKANRRKSAQLPSSCALPWPPCPSWLPASQHSELHPSFPKVQQLLMWKSTLSQLLLDPAVETLEPRLVLRQISLLSSSDLHKPPCWWLQSSHTSLPEPLQRMSLWWKRTWMAVSQAPPPAPMQLAR